MDWRAAKALRGERCFRHMNYLSLLPDVTESRKKRRIITQLLPRIPELCGHLSRLMGLREDTTTQMALMQLKYPGAMLKVHMRMLVAIQITLQYKCNSLLVAARKLSVGVIGSWPTHKNQLMGPPSIIPPRQQASTTTSPQPLKNTQSKEQSTLKKKKRIKKADAPLIISTQPLDFNPTAYPPVEPWFIPSNSSPCKRKLYAESSSSESADFTSFDPLSDDSLSSFQEGLKKNSHFGDPSWITMDDDSSMYSSVLTVNFEGENADRFDMFDNFFDLESDDVEEHHDAGHLIKPHYDLDESQDIAGKSNLRIHEHLPDEVFMKIAESEMYKDKEKRVQRVLKETQDSCPEHVMPPPEQAACDDMAKDNVEAEKREKIPIWEQNIAQLKSPQKTNWEPYKVPQSSPISSSGSPTYTPKRNRITTGYDETVEYELLSPITPVHSRKHVDGRDHLKTAENENRQQKANWEPSKVPHSSPKYYRQSIIYTPQENSLPTWDLLSPIRLSKPSGMKNVQEQDENLKSYTETPRQESADKDSETQLTEQEGDTETHKETEVDDNIEYETREDQIIFEETEGYVREHRDKTAARMKNTNWMKRPFALKKRERKPDEDKSDTDSDPIEQQPIIEEHISPVRRHPPSPKEYRIECIPKEMWDKYYPIICKFRDRATTDFTLPPPPGERPHDDLSEEIPSVELFTAGRQDEIRPISPVPGWEMLCSVEVTNKCILPTEEAEKKWRRFFYKEEDLLFLQTDTRSNSEEEEESVTKDSRPVPSVSENLGPRTELVHDQQVPFEEEWPVRENTRIEEDTAAPNGSVQPLQTETEVTATVEGTDQIAGPSTSKPIDTTSLFKLPSITVAKPGSSTVETLIKSVSSTVTPQLGISAGTPSLTGIAKESMTPSFPSLQEIISYLSSIQFFTASGEPMELAISNDFQGLNTPYSLRLKNKPITAEEESYRTKVPDETPMVVEEPMQVETANQTVRDDLVQEVTVLQAAAVAPESPRTPQQRRPPRRRQPQRSPCVTYAESDEEEPSMKRKKRKKTRVVRPNVPLEAELEQPEPAEPPERADISPPADNIQPREDVVLDDARRWGRRDTVLYLREKVSELGQNLRFSDCCEPGVCDRLTTASFFRVLLDLDAEERLNLKDIGGLGNPNQILIEGLSDTFFRDLL